MTQSDEDRALLIKKLLNKAQARGTTPAEAEAFTAKATALMVQWGIDDALVASVDRVKVEQIVKAVYAPDVPKSYSYEYVNIVVGIAGALNCRGVVSRRANGTSVAIVVGFESDVERVKILAESLVLQCTMQLGAQYADAVEYWWNGTDKFNWKRSFIVGFADGATEKLTRLSTETVRTAGASTALVLVDRKSQVSKWVVDNMSVTMGRSRRYVPSGTADGRVAGRNANVGGNQLGGSSKAVGK